MDEVGRPELGGDVPCLRCLASRRLRLFVVLWTGTAILLVAAIASVLAVCRSLGGPLSTRWADLSLPARNDFLKNTPQADLSEGK